MNESYWYKSSRTYKKAQLSEIIECVRQTPNLTHKIWQEGWQNWQNWYDVRELRPLKDELKVQLFHYIGPEGRNRCTAELIIANILLHPKKNHRIWYKGWSRWKHWHEVPRFAEVLKEKLPNDKAAPRKTSKKSKSKLIKQKILTDTGYNVLAKVNPTISLEGHWNLLDGQWQVLAEEDLHTILEELQNSFPNLTWRSGWVNNVVALFWTVVLDCCYGLINGNGSIRTIMGQEERFCLPKVCTFYPQALSIRSPVLRIKTSHFLQKGFFDQEFRTPSLGDQSPFRNSRIWAAITHLDQEEIAKLSIRRRLCWVLHKMTGYSLLHINQIFSAYEQLALSQLHHKHIFEVGELGALHCRKARTNHHLYFETGPSLDSLVWESWME